MGESHQAVEEGVVVNFPIGFLIQNLTKEVVQG